LEDVVTTPAAPASLHTPLTLDRLAPGQIATIMRVHGPSTMRRRLLEMGLVRGETIAVERCAPLGDPVEYLIKGYFLSLRRRDAAQIEVDLQV
jgi:Fe2+ transport system protein FeoA